MKTHSHTLYTAGLLAALAALLASCEAPSPITGPVDEARPDRFLADPVTITSATSEEAKLLADDGASGDLFGYSVAVGGDVAIVGAHGNQDNGTNSGSAYIFRRSGSTWLLEQKLVPNDGAALDHFGVSVAISGDVALVGAHIENDGGVGTGSGSVYVFRWNGASWAQEQKLLPGDGAPFDFFGFSVAIDGHVAVVGAYGNDDSGAFTGSAYVFRGTGSTWVEEQKLIAADGAAGDQFGFSVSISGDIVLVGAARDGDDGSESGSAYVFRSSGSTWVQEQKLTADDAAAGDRFGGQVSVSGDAALVGAAGDDDNGSAYVFRAAGSTWAQEQKLLADDGASGDALGGAVAISGDHVVLGAVGDDDNGLGAGSAYVFRGSGSTWTQEEKLLASDGESGAGFGFSVAIGGDRALVGAWHESTNGTNAGAAYVFEIAPPTPAERAEALIASVEQLRDDGTLGRGIANALISKLENALAKIEQGNVRAATGMLGAFINQVEALSGRRIPGDVADSLIAEATAIIEQLEMPAG